LHRQAALEVPLASGNATAGAGYAYHFEERSCGIGHLLENEAGEHRIECSFGKGEFFHRTRLKLGPRFADRLPGKRHVGWDWVDTDHPDGRAGQQERGTQAPRAAADIKDALSILDPGKPDERRRQASAPAAHEALVGGGIEYSCVVPRS
jgi:hypothetical protein